MKGKKISLVQLLLLIFSVFIPVVQANSVNASVDWGDQFITHSELEDGSGNPKTNFSIYDSMQAKWDFNIPAGKATAGDTMTVDIPSVFTLATKVNFDIKDSGGIVIGKAVADPTTKKVTITLTDAVNQDHNAITGSFDVWLNWDTAQVQQNTTVNVDWGTTGSTTVNIEPSSGPDPEEMMYKWGWYDTNDPTLIHWRVRINYAKQAITNAVYTDTVGGNQKLVSGSITPYTVTFKSDHESFDVGQYYEKSATTENGANGFTTKLGDISGAVLIDYETRVTDGGASAYYENTGKLTGENIVTKEVTVNTPSNGGGGSADTTENVSGTKTWVDDNNADHTRPESITVDLYQNGVKANSKQVTAKDNWQYSFNDLAKYDSQGKVINYTVKEEPVAGYNSQQKGYDFVNTEISVTPKNPIPVNPSPNPSFPIPSQTDVPTIPGNKNSVADFSLPKNFLKSEKNEIQSNGQLPQTGQDKSKLFLVLGILIICSSATILFWNKRKRQD